MNIVALLEMTMYILRSGIYLLPWISYNGLMVINETLEMGAKGVGG